MRVSESQLILGLDIGSASIGWALIDPAAEKVAAAGVRVFPAGADEKLFQQGREGSSNNTARRQKRLQRRQLRRRAGRQRELFLTLQGAGLLPGALIGIPGRTGGSEARHAVIEALDASLRATWVGPMREAGIMAPDHALPYFLRARALDEKLEPFALGRALYHLGQRRGFKSNRREASGNAADRQKAADERSKVKGGIAGLRHEISRAGARTVGEYFSHLDPADYHAVRRRWTGRDMFEDEFAAIWEKQAQFHPTLTLALRKRLRRNLFFQRPVRPGIAGKCSLEADQNRAPLASLVAQRFRLLQRVNDLRVVAPDQSERVPDAGERAALLGALENEGDLSFAEIKKRKLVNLPRGYRFNLEAGGEKRMPGNRTNVAFRGLLGESWSRLSEPSRERLVARWLAPELSDAKWLEDGRTLGLPADKNGSWLDPRLLEDDYAKLSSKAMRALLPLMEGGVAFRTAVERLYPQLRERQEPLDRLPPVKDALPEIANPAVMRALTELRKLVNAIVREHGKPWLVRIELARDLKRNAAQRERLSKNMRSRESERRRAEQAVREAHGTGSPYEISKYMLWEAGRGQCPYCGRQISLAELLANDQIEIDHILPRSQFPDDSFGNKCVAHTGCNREKGNRTPYEAFAADKPRWEAMLELVKNWGDDRKLEVFQCTSEGLDLNDGNSFASRRLNETRYTTSQAANYLSRLYGGLDVEQSDGTRRRVIQATSGMATAALRRGWELEKILRQPEPSENGKNPGKPRHDHRHHAIDAVVIALTSAGTIQKLSMAAAASAAAAGVERVSRSSLQAPWHNFVDRVRPTIEAIRVSHRPRRGLHGELHNETNYSRPHEFEGRAYVHVRKPVYSLAGKQVENIVDPAVRKAVVQKMESVGGDAKKLEFDPPMLATRSGRAVPIRRIRLRASRVESVRAIAAGDRERRVAESASHHVALFAGRDGKGRDRWFAEVVSRFEAARRHAACRCSRGSRCDCVVRRQSARDPEAEFLFSLMGGDLVEMAVKRGSDVADIYVVRTISESLTRVVEIDFVRHNLAAEVKDLKTMGEWVRITRMNELLERRCQKVVVDELGRVRVAHG